MNTYFRFIFSFVYSRKNLLKIKGCSVAIQFTRKVYPGPSRLKKISMFRAIQFTRKSISRRESIEEKKVCSARFNLLTKSISRRESIEEKKSMFRAVQFTQEKYIPARVD